MVFNWELWKACVVRTFIAVAIVIGVLYIQSNYSFTWRKFHQFSSASKFNISGTSHLKKILVWHFAYANKSLWFGFGHRPFVNSCPEENRCFLTSTKNLFEFKDYDAIIFHLRGLNSKAMPSTRFPEQRWIFYESESPAYLFDDLHRYNNLFNLTMTYREDSDFFKPYGFITNITTDENINPLKNYAKGKNKLVAWVVSHCKTASKREILAKNLQKYVQVDIYGKCGKKCSITKECFKKIERKYKFYLSFENSLCKDYVTEKFFGILQLDLVPIVYGAANYSKITPPHSYINVFDFKTVQDLAIYLKYLDKNDTAYNEYFNWRLKYKASRQATERAMCQLCHMLHNDNSTSIYTDMYSWYYTNKCYRKFPAIFDNLSMAG